MKDVAITSFTAAAAAAVCGCIIVLMLLLGGYWDLGRDFVFPTAGCIDV